MSDFWRRLDALVAASSITVDRPAGTAHPRYPELIYPLDYGYLEDTCAADGGGIDVWIGSLPERRVVGVICTVDTAKRDAEVKVLLGCTPDEARTALDVHNQNGQGGLLNWRAAEAEGTETR